MIINLEHINCDLCHSDKYKIRYRKPDTWLWINQFEFPVVECLNCGLVYVNPRPDKNSMSKYYPEYYYTNRNSEEHLKRYEIQCEFLPKLKNEKVLDIGCARGDFLIYLKNKYPNIDAYGIDFYSEQLKSNNITFLKKSLIDCNFKSNFFDLVMAWAVFEHLHEPSKYFQEVSRILKKNCKFIFLVTNSESLYGKKAFMEDLPRHTYHFSEKTLTKYAQKYGFKMNNCFYDDRIFDGRGFGTFYFGLPFIFGGNWVKLYLDEYNFFQRLLKYIGKFLDKIVFKTHWEAKLKMSGVIIVEFEKI